MDLSGVSLPCYVLEDGRRVLSGRGLQEALNMIDVESTSQPSGARLDRYLSQKSLEPYIYQGKEQGHYDPVQCLNGTAKLNGFEATILVDLCEAFLKARNEIKLSPRQAIIAKQCEILVTAFAKTGIVALVDEATGYQYDRAKDELAKILGQFIEEDYQKWTRTFPLEFYMEIARLKKWTPRRRGEGYIWPQVVGHYTNDFVYGRLAPGILDELKKKNPSTKGRRKVKHHQWLTGEIGHPRLMAHLEGLKMIMKFCDTWEQFVERADQEYPVIETTELGFDINKKTI